LHQTGHQYSVRVIAPSGITKLKELPAVKADGAFVSSDSDVYSHDSPLALKVGATTAGGYRVSVYKKDREVTSTVVAFGEGGGVESLLLTLPTTATCEGVLRITVRKLAKRNATQRNATQRNATQRNATHPDNRWINRCTGKTAFRWRSGWCFADPRERWASRWLPTRIATHRAIRSSSACSPPTRTVYPVSRPCALPQGACACARSQLTLGHCWRDTCHAVRAHVGVAVTDDAVLEMVQRREQVPRLPAMAIFESDVAHLEDAHVYLDPTHPLSEVRMMLIE
jgi:hypothetical protein